MLDIYEMQIFLMAAEAGSFSEAGRRLQLSQPAVSMQIRSLEKRLGIELFHRAGRHIRLSEAGQALVPLARDLVNLSIHTEEAITSLKGEVFGMLKLGCSTTAGKYILPKLIARFIEHFPEVQVTCHVGSRGTALQQVLDGDAQIAITSLRETSKDLEFRPFILDPIVMIAPPDHPWAGAGTVSLRELATSRFILRELTSGTRQAVADALAAHDVSLGALDCVMVMGNSEAIIEAVAEGIGVSFVSYQAAVEGIEHGRVIGVDVAGVALEQQLYMVKHAHRAPTTAQSSFWEFVYQSANRDLLEANSQRPGAAVRIEA
ncbi:MAG: LysR family transcriptional regulator [Anaerolineae bacterium]|nr:LysR family transcriptional regulator [Anaerolineae bacterium]